MPLLEFTDQKTGKVYTYEVSKYSCERADRDPEGSQPGSNRWNRQQSLFLIETMPTVLAEYERSNKKKHEAYEEVAKLLKEKGHRFAVEQVKNKWLLLQRLYKQNLDLKGTSGAGKITWEYFQ
ncbi:hypothetical protein B566_EDAN018283, partial [Ephemera danica]